MVKLYPKSPQERQPQKRLSCTRNHHPLPPREWIELVYVDLRWVDPRVMVALSSALTLSASCIMLRRQGPPPLVPPSAIPRFSPLCAITAARIPKHRHYAKITRKAGTAA